MLPFSWCGKRLTGHQPLMRNVALKRAVTVTTVCEQHSVCDSSQRTPTFEARMHRSACTACKSLANRLVGSMFVKLYLTAPSAVCFCSTFEGVYAVAA